MKEIIDCTTKYPIIDWMGYKWELDMPGSDKIHPDNPFRYYHSDSIIKFNDDLLLSVFKIPRTVKRWDGKSYDSEYSCGLIRSTECFSYGVYTLDCILPKGRNLHSAFWLTNEKTWPPEIDIFEGYSNIFGGYKTFNVKPHKFPPRCGYSVETNVHYGTENHLQIGPNGCSTNVLINPTNEINRYTLIWTPEYIHISYNNTLVRYVDERSNNELFKQLNKHPWMYVIINNIINKNKNAGLHVPLILKHFNYTKL